MSQAIEASLSNISKNTAWRKAFIAALLDFEHNIVAPGVDVRSEITGPFVDALFAEDETIQKTLSDGTLFEFFYRSKIARDFIMSEPDMPDHAWEPQTTKTLLHLAKDAKNVVVGGAYFGDHSILIAKKIAANQGVVHAFEPNHDQRNMLLHNAKLNSLNNIQARSEGLWENSSTNLALVGYDSFAHSETVEAHREDAFQTITMEDYLKSQEVNQLDLIMLDIEGAELSALKGAEKFLAQPAGQAPDIVFEVHRHYVDWSAGLTNTELIKYLNQHDYQVYAIRDYNSNVNMPGKSVEIIPAEEVYLEGPPHGFNMVASKKPMLFTDPLFKVCTELSPKLLRHKNVPLHQPMK